MTVYPRGTWNGAGWFRQVIEVDTLLFNKPVAFQVTQKGASEIYLNGKLVYRLGTPGTGNEKIFLSKGEPIAVQLDNTKYQTIAVRYSNQNAERYFNRYGTWYNMAGFQVVIAPLNNSITSHMRFLKGTTTQSYLFFGLTFSLAVLHLLIFFFYSRQKENLYYSLFTGSLAFVFLNSFYLQTMHSYAELEIIINISQIILLTLMFVAYDLFLYSIFYNRMPKSAWGIISAGVILSVFLALWFTRQWMVNYIFFPFLILLSVEGLRVIVLAIKRRKRNAIIIGVGVMAFFFMIIVIAVINVLGVVISQFILITIYYGGLLLLPLSMTIYIARENGKTKNDLEDQLEQVKRLSEKAIEQEKVESQLRIEKEIERSENERKTRGT